MCRPLAGESEAGCDAAPVSAWTDGVLLERAAAAEAGNDLRLDQPNPRLVGLRPAAGGVASGVSACEGVAEAEGAGRPWIAPTLGPESKRRPAGSVAAAVSALAGSTSRINTGSASLYGVHCVNRGHHTSAWFGTVPSACKA